MLDCGDPKTAQMVLLAEAPGKNEVVHLLDPEHYFWGSINQTNLNIRKKYFPDIPEKIRKLGMPLVGKSGMALNQWFFNPLGIKREQTILANTLRCLPPKHGESHYPIGEERKEAEQHCRQYDNLIEAFKPDIAIITIHPAAVLREAAPYPLVLMDFQKARDFVKAGTRPVVLTGGKAVKRFLGYGENVTKFRGHYQWLEDR